MILTLFIFYEITLGRQSYWYPYLLLMPLVEFSCNWARHEINQFQDYEYALVLKEYQEDIDLQWNKFIYVLAKYPKIFKYRYIDRGLFDNVYGQVCSRCFDYGLPSAGMIPMADNLNHSSVEVVLHLVNTEKHLQGEQDPEYYRIHKHINDYSALFKARPDMQADKESLDITGRYKTDVFEKHVRAFGVTSYRSQMVDHLKQVWQLPYTLDRYYEDCDLSSEEDSEEEDDDVMLFGHEDQQYFDGQFRRYIDKGRKYEYLVTKERQALKQ